LALRESPVGRAASSPRPGSPRSVSRAARGGARIGVAPARSGAADDRSRAALARRRARDREASRAGARPFHLALDLSVPIGPLAPVLLAAAPAGDGRDRHDRATTLAAARRRPARPARERHPLRTVPPP